PPDGPAPRHPPRHGQNRPDRERPDRDADVGCAPHPGGTTCIGTVADEYLPAELSPARPAPPGPRSLSADRCPAGSRGAEGPLLVGGRRGEPGRHGEGLFAPGCGPLRFRGVTDDPPAIADDEPAESTFRLDEVLSPNVGRSLRKLPNLVAMALRITWRAARREFLAS